MSTSLRSGWCAGGGWPSDTSVPPVWKGATTTVSGTPTSTSTARACRMTSRNGGSAEVTCVDCGKALALPSWMAGWGRCKDCITERLDAFIELASRWQVPGLHVEGNRAVLDTGDHNHDPWRYLKQ